MQMSMRRHSDLDILKVRGDCGISVVKDRRVRINKKNSIEPLCKPIEESAIIAEGLYEKVNEERLIIGQMVDLVGRFREILSLEKVEILQCWMAEANSDLVEGSVTS